MLGCVWLKGGEHLPKEALSSDPSTEKENKLNCFRSGLKATTEPLGGKGFKY
jgi:hypothetical protein